METFINLKYVTIRENTTSLLESDLVETALNGDLEAFNQLVILYQDKIFNLTLRILGDEDSAKDVTQNTFLNAYRSFSGYRNGPFRSWLYRIATNACYDELRRRRRHPLQSLPDEDGEEMRESQPYDLSLLSILPEKEYERRESNRIIQQAIARLEAGQRAVVVLVDLQGFDYKEAAQVLGIPMGTVRSRLARARLHLRHLLIGSLLG